MRKNLADRRSKKNIALSNHVREITFDDKVLWKKAIKFDLISRILH
jgi:hypothetical protein